MLRHLIWMINSSPNGAYSHFTLKSNREGPEKDANSLLFHQPMSQAPRSRTGENQARCIAASMGYAPHSSLSPDSHSSRVWCLSGRASLLCAHPFSPAQL